MDDLGEVAARFWARVEKAADDGCWRWQGAARQHGYGVVRVGGRAGRTVQVQRLAWQLETGTPPPAQLRNMCGDPLCVRPGHWRLAQAQAPRPLRRRARMTPQRPARPGHVRRHGRRWQIAVYAGVDERGRRRYLYGSAPTEETAEQVRERLLRRAAPLRRAGAHTIAELYPRWLEHASDGMSPRSAEEAERHGRLHILPHLGELLVAELDGERLDDWFATLRAGGLQARSARRVASSLRSALERARKWGWVDANPMGLAEPPKFRRRRIEPPSIQEVVRLLARAEEDSPMFGVFCRLAMVTGARRGELAALRWPQVSWPDRALTIDRGLLIVGRQVVEWDTKRGSDGRIALDERTLELLWQVREQQRAHGAPLGAYVFSPWPDGRDPYRPDAMTRRWARIRRLEGLGHVRLHDLRHHAATALLRGGVDVLEVAGRLRHADPHTTLQQYGYFQPASDYRSAHLLAAMLDTASAPVSSRNGASPEKIPRR